MAPNPVFSVLNVSTVQVEWAAPFTLVEFPIMNYTVQVINQTSDDLLNSAVLDADMLSYNITHTAPPSCTNLTFLVVAYSEVGPSVPGTAQGAFPFSKSVFIIN